MWSAGTIGHKHMRWDPPVFVKSDYASPKKGYSFQFPFSIAGSLVHQGKHSLNTTKRKLGQVLRMYHRLRPRVVESSEKFWMKQYRFIQKESVAMCQRAPPQHPSTTFPYIDWYMYIYI